MRLIILTAIFIFALGGLIATFAFTARDTARDALHVDIYDVGQGSSARILGPTGVEIIVDTGPGQALFQEFSTHRSFFDRHLDGVILTHFDSDHIEATRELIERYDIDHLFIGSTPTNDDTIAADVLVVAEEHNVDVIQLDAGDTLSLGGGAVLEILWPGNDVDRYDDNDKSLAMKVTYGKSSLLITGDASKTIEDRLVMAYGSRLESELLVLGHHGSRTSTSARFLRTVNPELAVVSAAADSRFGHPHEDVIALVNSFSIPLVTTFEGTLSYRLDPRGDIHEQ